MSFSVKRQVAKSGGVLGECFGAAAAVRHRHPTRPSLEPCGYFLYSLNVSSSYSSTYPIERATNRLPATPVASQATARVGPPGLRLYWIAYFCLSRGEVKMPSRSSPIRYSSRSLEDIF